MKDKYTIGIPRETKYPVDNRAVFSPEQAKRLMSEHPGLRVIVEASDIRCFSDDAYRDNGITVVNDLSMSDCDIIVGIKEQKIDYLIPKKHYVFFGHFAKLQEYNRELARALLANGNTFTDHEYLVDKSGRRLCAFGRYAGIVGAYNAIRGYGLRERDYEIPVPNSLGVVEKLEDVVSTIERQKLPDIVFTGGGNVAKGCREFLSAVGYVEEVTDDLEGGTVKGGGPVFRNLQLEDMVRRKDGRHFDRDDFSFHPECYEGCIVPRIEGFPVLVSCHYWGDNDPVYLDHDDLRQLSGSLKLVADVTCDICGGLKCTLRSSTHDDPYYDYNPMTMEEEEAFSGSSNITIMAVDTLPNAVPITSSVFFGEKFMELIIPGLLGEDDESSEAINRATIIRDGCLTPKYLYLSDFLKS